MFVAQAQVGALGGSSPDKTARMQPPCGQPDAQPVVHEEFDAVGAFVGEQVDAVGVGCAEDGHDACQCAVDARTHVQRGRCQPDGVDAQGSGQGAGHGHGVHRATLAAGDAGLLL